jgi:hypothetical protein
MILLAYSGQVPLIIVFLHINALRLFLSYCSFLLLILLCTLMSKREETIITKANSKNFILIVQYNWINWIN